MGQKYGHSINKKETLRKLRNAVLEKDSKNKADRKGINEDVLRRIVEKINHYYYSL